LIRYDSIAGVEGKRSVFRPRVVLLASAWLLIIAGFVFTLVRHEDFQVTLVRAIESPYQVLPAERAVMNHFKIEFYNQAFEERMVRVSLPEEQQKSGYALITQSKAQNVPAGKSLKTHYFVKFPESALVAGSGRVRLRIEASGLDSNQVKILEKEAPLVGPIR
jgi:hypothetical protein